MGVGQDAAYKFFEVILVDQATKPSRLTQESTGSSLRSTTNVSLEDSLPPVRSIEVSDKRVTEPPTEDLQEDHAGRRETLKSLEEDEIDFKFPFYQNNISFF